MGTPQQQPKTASDQGKRPLAQVVALSGVPFSVHRLGTPFLLVNQAK